MVCCCHLFLYGCGDNLYEIIGCDMLQVAVNNSLQSYDPLVPDAYVSRLAMANHSCGVRASENIYNSHDVLLLAQHSVISTHIASVIANNRLKKPLEYCVVLDRVLDQVQLETMFIALIHEDDFLHALNEHQELTSLIKPYIKHALKFPLLMQKLSVMSVTMSEVLLRTIYCTWIALLIAKEMRFSERGCIDTFLAALAHDIGMLHVSSALLEKQETLTPDDWRQIQRHVVIGKYWLENMPGIPKDVVEAVYEHHERCDGTGYPKGLVESELSYAGKIVGLADSLVAIYRKRFKNSMRSWRDVIPIVQMNAQAYFFRHDQILGVIWRRSEMPFKNVVEDDALPEFIASLLNEYERLNSWFEILRDSLLSLGFIHGDRKLHSLQNVMLHVTTSVKGSGVFNAEINEWLRRFNEDHGADAYRKIENAYVKQQEVEFHLLRLNRMIQLYLYSAEEKNSNIISVLTLALEKTKEFATAHH